MQFDGRRNINQEIGANPGDKRIHIGNLYGFMGYITPTIGEKQTLIKWDNSVNFGPIRKWLVSILQSSCTWHKPKLCTGYSRLENYFQNEAV